MIKLEIFGVICNFESIIFNTPMINFKINKLAFLAFFGIFIFTCCEDEDRFKTDTATFEKLELDKGTYWNGSDMSGLFVSGNKIFHNQYYADWNTWSGFAYSNVINYNYYTPESMYAAFPSGGANESENYAIAHQIGKIVITFQDENGEEPRSVQLTNTTYSALAILYGYDYAKKFGGRDGRDPDWFKVTITGIGMVEQINGTIDFFLADYRFDDDEEDYVVDKWEYVDLTSLGRVKRLEFEVSSSDAGTPLYFCLDNLKGRIPFD